MKRSIITFVYLSLLSVVFLHAAKVDTISVHSPSMDKEIKAAVILPDGYSADKNYPVVYLLHGYSGNFRNWVNDNPGTKDLADQYNTIVVCPDGAFSSWYWDSPVDETMRFETFVSKELIEHIDSAYKTIASRNGRAITGLSMGGHGGLYLGFRHQDVFGACGSMSGGVDIRPFPNEWEMHKRIGRQAENPQNWEDYTVMNQLHLLTPNSTRIIFDCGTSDFFYDVNVRLHEELKYRNIPHDFISRPGNHDMNYWSNAVKYQFLFFSTMFEQTR